jgi:hypothetical protein
MAKYLQGMGGGCIDAGASWRRVSHSRCVFRTFRYVVLAEERAVQTDYVCCMARTRCYDGLTDSMGLQDRPGYPILSGLDIDPHPLDDALTCGARTAIQLT